MANTIKRSHSRRRIAALSFLSNITLDGSYSDTKFAIPSKNGSIIKAPFMCTEPVLPEESENVGETYVVDFHVDNVREKLIQTPILERKTVKKYRASNSDSDTESITPSKTHVDECSFKSRTNKEKYVYYYLKFLNCLQYAPFDQYLLIIDIYLFDFINIYIYIYNVHRRL